MDEQQSWYRRRSYAHFDRPISESQATTLVTNPDRVSRHAFWPVILNPKKSISIKSENGRRVWQTKIRPIVYAAHSDAHIYAYYAKSLGDLLEDRYSELGGEHVLAYRRFSPARCNVHFAYEAFTEIAAKEACDVIAIDVEGFFDALDHTHLKAAWAGLLGTFQLPSDHYAVFKACTRDTAIAMPKLRDLFGGEIKRRAGKAGRAICNPEEFRSHVKPHLRSRHDLVWEVKGKPAPVYLKGQPAGIPQGLPISAVLANLYMYDADQSIQQSIRKLGGGYRRYSDDILLIVPNGRGAEAESVVKIELGKIRLQVNSAKTVRCRFLRKEGSLRSFSVDENFIVQSPSSASYLGLTFDGRNMRVRDSTTARFMIKANRAIDRARIAAAARGESRLKKRQLYARLTSLGYGTAYGDAVYGQSNQVLPKGAPRLGFFKYLQLAAKVTNSDAIRTQIRQIENQVFREIDRAEKRLKKHTAAR
ncbi:MAG: reverse transcriptase domain-containing protein [Marinobacter salsuginis]